VSVISAHFATDFMKPNFESNGRATAVFALVVLSAVRLAAQDTTHVRRLSLGDAARLAARQSAAAEAARYSADQAGARVKERRADLLPSVSASALQQGESINTATFGISFPSAPGQPPLFNPNGQVIGGIHSLDLRGRFSQTLLDVGALKRMQSARADARASDADARNVAEQAAATAAASYLGVQRADAQLSARIADSVLADSLLVIARAQVRAGVGVGLDVTRAQSQLASVRAQLIAARNQLARARLDLLRALGLPLDSDVQLADSLGALPVCDTLPDEQAAIERALRQRPDLRAASERLRASEQSLAATKAERLPTLSVYGNQGVIGKKPSDLLGTYTWGVQVTLPILDGFGRQARAEEREAAAREVEVRRRDLRQQASIEVRGALLDIASAREQLAAAGEQLRLAREELAQARDRFRAGVAGNADVITAALRVNDSRTNVIDALTSYQSARVALATAQGAVTTLP
jgi:outer membrane protein